MVSGFLDMGPLGPEFTVACKLEIMPLGNLIVGRKTADSPCGSCLHTPWMHTVNGNRRRNELGIQYDKKSG